MARAGPSGTRTTATEDVMPAGLILQFANNSLEDYDRVNAQLGIDPKSGTGNWPDGLLSHAAGMSDGLVVMEVWGSRDAQGRFMHGRLGEALQKGGITERPTITWIDLVSYLVPQSAPAG
jgi:hypothetical protein